MTGADREAARILAEYERRERDIGREFYALTKPANLFIRHGQQRALLWALRTAGALPLEHKRILEVGCGRGQWLTVFEDFGARRENLAGIDLDPQRIGEARHRYPGADLQTGDATRLPWHAWMFDIVFQSTMFSSILDHAVRKLVADEMRRVLKPQGIAIWYDLRFDNPSNRNVRGISPRELRDLFPGCSVTVQPVTLATPLARRLVPRSWLLAAALERLGLLNTHLIGLIRNG